MRGRDGDQFTDFMLSRWAWLLRLARALTGDPRLAEEAAVAALARARAMWPQLRHADDPDAHVRRILVRSAARSAAGQAAGPGPPPVSPPADGAAAEGGDAEGGDAEGGDAEGGQPPAVLAALAELPPRQRAVVVLRYWEDLPDTQVAAALRCSRATVRAEAGRALAALAAAGLLGPGSGGRGPRGGPAGAHDGGDGP